MEMNPRPTSQNKVSDEAPGCPECGHHFSPRDEDVEPADRSFFGVLATGLKEMVKLVPQVRYPITVFTFGIMACSAFFAVSAAFAVRYDEHAFKWAVHMFLGMMGVYALIILYCPKALYIPDDLIRLKEEGIKVRDKPGIVVLLAMTGLLVYMGYYLVHLFRGNV